MLLARGADPRIATKTIDIAKQSQLDRAATTLKGKWRVVNPDDGKEMSDDFTAVRR